MYACYCKTTSLQFGISGHWYWQTEPFRGQTIPINKSETQHGLGTKTTVMSMLLLGDIKEVLIPLITSGSDLNYTCTQTKQCFL